MTDQLDPDTITSPLIDLAESAAAGIADHLGEEVEITAETNLTLDVTALELHTSSARIVITPRENDQ